MLINTLVANVRVADASVFPFEFAAHVSIITAFVSKLSCRDS